MNFRNVTLKIRKTFDVKNHPYDVDFVEFNKHSDKELVKNRLNKLLKLYK